jgi:Neocarzinostatin family/Sushi repeat (SCR repeat)
MRLARFVIALLVAPLLLTLQAQTAAAAPPSNDTFAGATPATIGFTEELDTTEATTDADDAQLNATCGAPATDASVWYAFTTAADTGVVVDVSQSSYSAGVLVGVGTPGNLTTVTCGPGTVTFFVAAGTTYYVLAIDDQFDGGGNGGTLRISFNPGPPPPTLDITVDQFGGVDARTGVATITGTYTCTSADSISVFVGATQDFGRFTVSGSGAFFDGLTCDGTTRSWSADVFPQGGKFAGGKAMTVTFAVSCGPLQCAFDFEERTVQLRGGLPECPTLVAAPHTSFTLSNGYAVGSVATFTADSGYALVGPTSLRCRGDGSWSGPVPTAEGTGSVTVTPNTGLVDGQTVTVTLAGFPALGTVGWCQGVPVEPASSSNCGGPIRTGQTDASGGLTDPSYPVARFIFVPTLGRTVDCAAETCVIGAADVTDIPGSVANAYLSFSDTDPPA